MLGDPLFDAISDQRVLTLDDIERALRWRLVEAQRLDNEVRVLRMLQDRLYLEAEVRRERDPPIEASESARY